MSYPTNHNNYSQYGAAPRMAPTSQHRSPAQQWGQAAAPAQQWGQSSHQYSNPQYANQYNSQYKNAQYPNGQHTPQSHPSYSSTPDTTYHDHYSPPPSQASSQPVYQDQEHLFASEQHAIPSDELSHVELASTTHEDETEIPVVDETMQTKCTCKCKECPCECHWKKEPSLWILGWKGIKSNLAPGLALQAFGLLLVILYYSTTGVKNFFDSIAEVKASAGYGFSFISTALCGGFFPWLIMFARMHYRRYKAIKAGQPPPGRRPGGPNIYVEGLFVTIFWGLKGIEVDAFYRLQSIIWGSEQKLPIIFSKVIIDQFVYNPVYACSSVMLPYALKDMNFAFHKWWVEVVKTEEYWKKKLPVALMTTWMVWIPSVTIVYCLPSSLQVILFNIILCFWSLIVSFISEAQTK